MDSLQYQGNKLTLTEIKNLHTITLDYPTILQPNFDPLKRAFPADDVLDAAYVRGFKVFVPVKDQGLLTGQLRLYALPGTSHSAKSTLMLAERAQELQLLSAVRSLEDLHFHLQTPPKHLISSTNGCTAA